MILSIKDKLGNSIDIEHVYHAIGDCIWTPNILEVRSLSQWLSILSDSAQIFDRSRFEVTEPL